MTLGDVGLWWLGSVLIGTLICAVAPRGHWYVGLVSTLILGPLGLLVVAYDVLAKPKTASGT